MFIDLSDILIMGLGASGGAAAGWKLRDKKGRKAPRWHSDRAFVGQTLSDLQAVSNEARSLVESHRSRLEELLDALAEQQGSGESKQCVQNLICDNNRLVQQLDSIESGLHRREEEIQWWLREHPPKAKPNAEPEPPEESPAERVLDDLRQIAKQVSGTIERHRESVEDCNARVDPERNSPSTNIVEAVGALIEAATQMQADIVAADSKLQEQSKALATQAATCVTDPLTGLMNRGEFDREIARCSDFFDKNDRPFAVFMIDIDRFKSINDRYGHSSGDSVLQGVAGVLGQQCRPSDFLARYGGEELGCRVLEADPKKLRMMSLRQIKAVREAQTLCGSVKINVTASLGVAIAGKGEPPEDVVDRADKALYAAKHAGRDQVFFHDGDKPVSWGSVLDPTEQRAEEKQQRRRRSGDKKAAKKNAEPQAAEKGPQAGEAARALLSSRTVFFHSVNRSLALWKRGGPNCTIALLHIDPRPAVQPDSDAAQLLHDAVAKLLDANTREMDHCCDFDRGIYAVLLQQMKVTDAVIVAARIHAAALEVKVDAGRQGVVAINPCVGVAECDPSDTAVELISRATKALEASARTGEQAVHVSYASGKTVSVPLKKKTQTQP